MKVGDLVRFLEVAPDVLASEVDTPMPVGVILERYTEELTIGVPGGMVSVLWNDEGPGHRSDRLYRASVLEVVNESR